MKYILTVLLLTGFFAIPSCLVKECDPTLPFWDIASFDVQLGSGQGIIYADEIYTGDTLYLILDFKHVFLSQLHFSFIHTSSATQPCPSSGDQGPKDAIASVEITSNTVFDDYPAAELLNPLVKGSLAQTLTLDTWIVGLNSLWETPYSAVMFFAAKPEQQLERTFTVKLKFQSGKELSATSEPITW